MTTWRGATASGWGRCTASWGLRVGLVQQGLDAEERKAAYQADITYVTNSELGL